MTAIPSPSSGTDKRCFKCGAFKPLSEFYRHAAMADGHLNKCKTCTRADVLAHRLANVDRVRQYDRERSKLPHRLAHLARQARRYRTEHPDRYAAHAAVNNAIRAGELRRHPCEVCGRADSHAHHDDYTRPLDVRWLCPVHHAEAHR